MKTEIKSRVQKAIEERNTSNKEYKAKIEDWKKDTLYSKEHKETQIAELEKKIQENNKICNELVKNIVIEEKMIVIGEPKAKSVDYQTQMSNALKFIEMSGNTLTDDKTTQLLSPFQDDYETMLLFKDVINTKTFNKATGFNSEFKKTFGKTDYMTSIRNSFKNAEEIHADSLAVNNSLSLGVKTGLFLDSINHIEELVNSIED